MQRRWQSDGVHGWMHLAVEWDQSLAIFSTTDLIMRPTGTSCHRPDQGCWQLVVWKPVRDMTSVFPQFMRLGLLDRILHMQKLQHVEVCVGILRYTVQCHSLNTSFMCFLFILICNLFQYVRYLDITFSVFTFWCLGSAFVCQDH